MRAYALYIISLVASFLVCVLLFEMLLATSPHIMAASPSFGIQEIKDKPLDWVNITTKQHTQNGDPSTDILSVDYFSNGKLLKCNNVVAHSISESSSTI